MERPLWDRIQEIYHSTLPMPRSERGAFVTSACNNDPFLVREVHSLLEADESSGGFLESPVFEVGLKIISSQNQNSPNGTSPVDNLIGATIDERYLVERELGQGGIGKVYVARDLKLHNRPVVIKILLQASLKDPYVVRKFRQEVEALSRIDHPGVVSVLGAGELADGKPYIVMQYVSGVTLRSQIPSEGMNLERAALILKQIGGALEDVHEKRIFHRDLKPDNIMLQVKSGAELVKVVDFGIAKVKDSVVAPSTVNKVPVGTLLYMSPEQLRGGEKITAASDIYSMAVIAYEMVTGRRPFNPASGPQLLEMHRSGVRVKPIDLRASLSTEAQAIMLRALSFGPAARYQSAAEFGNSLARALMNEGETAPTQNAKRSLPNLAYPTEPDGPATIQPASDQSPTPLIPKSDHALVNSVNQDRRPLGLGKNRLMVIGSFLIILIFIAGLVLSVYEGQGNENQNNQSQGGIDTTDANSGPIRSFTYSLIVQRMRAGKRYQEPYPSTGQDIFETGDKFRLNINSPAPGYLYLFNEGPPEQGDTSFTIIYPTPRTNNGSATLGANQSIQTKWNTFKGAAGTENFWIVWSTSPVAQLETAKTESFKHPKGGLTGENLVAVKQFLIVKQEEVKTNINRNKSSQQTTVRGAGDVLVRLVQLEHR